MFVFKIKEILLLRGYRPTPKQLMKMGIPLVAARQYLYNEAKSIKLEHLFKLCNELQCSPSDFLQVEMPEGFVWDQTMPLYEWRAKTVVDPFVVMKKLSPEKLRALNEFLESTENKPIE